MRSSGLVLIGVAALAVVGYAFYTLLAPSPPRSGASRARAETRSRAAADERDRDDDEGGEAARPAPARVGAKLPPPRSRPALPLEPSAAPREPAPRPTPEISLDEARKQFADFMAELDGIETSGMELTSPEWVEYYKRGHELLLPLQQHLDWQVPEQAEELRQANEGMRAKLSGLDPGRQPPPT